MLDIHSLIKALGHKYTPEMLSKIVADLVKKGIMEQYKYGPLTWATIDDDSGNYYYPGTPPTGYDEQGIPIDEKGLQGFKI